jgi:hypothetical protein
MIKEKNLKKKKWLSWYKCVQMRTDALVTIGKRTPFFLLPLSPHAKHLAVRTSLPALSHVKFKASQ